MKLVSFTTTARKIATTVSRRSGVQVMFKGTTAYTDSKCIVLPAIAPGVILTEKEESEFLGYLDHEISHVLFTDFDAFTETSKQGPLHQRMLNILEDPRVENLYIDKYPGSVSDLDALCDKLEGDYRSSLNVDGEKVGELNLSKAGQLIFEDAYTYRNRAVIRSETVHTFPQLAEIAVYIKRGVQASTTREAAVYSNKIVEALQLLFPEELKHLPPPPPPPSKGNKPGQPQPGQPQPGQPQPGQPQPGQPQPGQPQPGQPQPGQPQPGQPQPGQPQPGQPQPGQPRQDLQDLIDFLGEVADKNSKLGELILEMSAKEGDLDKKSKAVRKTVRGQNGDQCLPPVSTEGDRVFYYPKENLANYNRISEEISSEIRALKKGLHIYLKSRAKKSYERGLEQGSLDSSAVWKIRTGDHQRIFKEKKTVSMVDTAVVFMVDLSGSMDRRLTTVASILVADALSGVPSIKLNISGFTTGDGRFSGPGGRCVSLEIPTFKGFQDDMRACKARLGGLRTTSYTPLGEGFAYGLDLLLNRKESKRVVFLLTDGEPSFPVGTGGHNDYILMARVKEKCKNLGVKVVGLTLGRGAQDVLSPYSDLALHINDANELPAAVLKIVHDLVETRRT